MAVIIYILSNGGLFKGLDVQNVLYIDYLVIDSDSHNAQLSQSHTHKQFYLRIVWYDVLL